MSGAEVPGVDIEQYTKWICEGYGGCDQAELREAVLLRRDFYDKMCRRGVEEGDMPQDMDAFVRWVVSTFDKKVFDKI